MVMRKSASAPSNALNLYLSTGSGISYVGQVDPDYDKFSYDFVEVNGDGMNDLVIVPYSIEDFFWRKYSQADIYTADGDGTYTYEKSFNLVSTYSRPMFADVNGDKLMDYLTCKVYSKTNIGPEYQTVYVNLSDGFGQADAIQQINNGVGGNFTYTYSRSVEHENELLPFPVYHVASLTIDSTQNPAGTTDYSYSGGKYDLSEHEFRGFGTVKKHHPDGSVLETAFEMDKFRKGRPRTETLKTSSNGDALVITTYGWEDIPADDPWGFVKLNTKVVDIYDNPDNPDDRTGWSLETNSYSNISGHLISRVITGTDAEKITESYNYTQYDVWTWRKTSERITGAGTGTARHTQYRYDLNGNLEEREALCTNGAGLDCIGDYIVKYVYDSYGNVIEERDANTPDSAPATVKYTYDADTHAYPVTINYAVSDDFRLSDKKTWNTRFGKAATTTDVNGRTTTYTYDPFGRIQQVDHPDGGVRKFTYSDTASPRRILSQVKEDADNWINTWRYYDGIGREIQSVTRGASIRIDSAGNDIPRYTVSKRHYDEMGRLFYSTGPFFRSNTVYLDWVWNNYSISEYPWQRTYYDLRGRPRKISTPDEVGNAVKVTYQYNGFATSTSSAHIASGDAYWETTTITDHLGRIISVVEHDELADAATSYSHNAANDLTTVTNALGKITTITYNSLGRKVKMNDPDMGLWRYSYDANGNLITQTDAKGKTITFGYDKLNRLISKSYPAESNQPDAAYTYCTTNNTYNRDINRVNRLQSVSNGDVATTFKAYDPMGRATQILTSVAGASGSARKYARTEYDYDLSGKVAVIYYPEDDMDNLDDQTNYDVEYFYHPGSGLIQKIVDSENRTLAYLSNYQAGGKITKITYDNQVKTTYTYSPFSTRLESIFTIDRDAEPLMDKSYGYTLAGNIEDINDGVNSINFSYTYDRRHRLVDEVSSGAMAMTPMVIELTYDDSAKPLHAASQITVNGGVARSLSYDANGNTTGGWNLAEPANVVARNITYNTDNMPVSVENGSALTEFIYDVDGKRARKTSGSSSSYYFGDHFEYINGIPTRYVFAGNLRIAKVTPTSVYYYHKDHLGSSTVISTAGGKKADVESTTYLPYGGERGTGGISRSSYKFTDQEFDGETGLYNYDARLYDPVVGRFVSADSVVPELYNPQYLNRYSYCLNNPLKYKDPSGHFVVSGTIAVGYGSYVVGTAIAVGIAHYAAPIAADIGKWLGRKIFKSEETTTPEDTLSVNEEGKKDYKGGRHKDTKLPVGDSLDSHHTPSKDSYKDKDISPEDGPAIQMDPADHRKTGSYGNSSDAQDYRNEQRDLINQGNWDDAIQKDIDDVQSKCGDKYDDAISDMIDDLPDDWDDWGGR